MESVLADNVATLQMVNFAAKDVQKNTKQIIKMKKYRFKIGMVSSTANFNNDEEAKEFAEFIGAEVCSDTILFRGELNGKNFLIEMEIGNKNLDDFNVSDFKSITVW